VTLRLCSYNIEWFDDLFTKNNHLKTDNASTKRLEAIAAVLYEVNSDVVGVVEGPNHLIGGKKRAVKCLEAFASYYSLRTTKAMIGWPSAGRQEICLMYDASKVSVRHTPGGAGKKNPPFNKSLVFDTNDDRIKELYKFFRPPLEAEITDGETGKKIRVIVVHTKSKGIFSSSDYIHWERESNRNRRKLFAECSWVRKRVDEWLNAGHDVVVMGDINDGPGMDHYESFFGKSAVEIVMGNLYEPGRILLNHAGQPKWGKWGWEPSSTRFKDRITETQVNVLIDHIAVSQGLNVGGDGHLIWNPYREDRATSIKGSLLEASDHFPVSIDVVL